jgi:hypothetical protein
MDGEVSENVYFVGWAFKGTSDSTPPRFHQKGPHNCRYAGDVKKKKKNAPWMLPCMYISEFTTYLNENATYSKSY